MWHRLLEMNDNSNTLLVLLACAWLQHAYKVHLKGFKKSSGEGCCTLCRIPGVTTKCWKATHVIFKATRFFFFPYTAVMAMALLATPLLLSLITLYNVHMSIPPCQHATQLTNSATNRIFSVTDEKQPPYPSCRANILTSTSKERTILQRAKKIK